MGGVYQFSYFGFRAYSVPYFDDIWDEMGNLYGFVG